MTNEVLATLDGNLIEGSAWKTWIEELSTEYEKYITTQLEAARKMVRRMTGASPAAQDASESSDDKGTTKSGNQPRFRYHTALVHLNCAEVDLAKYVPENHLLLLGKEATENVRKYQSFLLSSERILRIMASALPQFRSLFSILFFRPGPRPSSPVTPIP